jgi:hypothetical protein
LIDLSQCDLLFPKPQLYEISLNIREIGLQQSLIAGDVVPVSLATPTALYKRHLDPPCYASIRTGFQFPLKAFVEMTGGLH